MTRPHVFLPALAALLAACSPGAPSREPEQPPVDAALKNEAAALADLQDRTEVAMLKKRVIELEREVGEMKATPQALDLELLNQRVQRLEGGGTATTPAVSDETSGATTPAADPERAQRAVDAAIAERRARRSN